METMKKFRFISIAIIWFGLSCQQEKLNKDDFCSFLNVKNFDKAIPFVDEFLSGLSDDLDDAQKLQELAAWLKSQPCIIDAAVLCQSCEGEAGNSLISVSFDENGINQEFVF